jgi:hypothetical protein
MSVVNLGYVSTFWNPSSGKVQIPTWFNKLLRTLPKYRTRLLSMREK